MMRQVISIDPEDVARYRLVEASIQAAHIKPEAYSRDEIEQMHIKKWRLIGELLTKYEVDDARRWVITPEGGSFIVGDDYDPE